jgi:regulatory protein
MRARRRGTPRSLHDRALGLLAVRPRSHRELRDRLLRAGFEATEIDDELARLEEVGLIDDERFARALAEHETAVRRSGSRALVGALRSKGIAPETVAELVTEHGEGDEERALELARSRAARMTSLAPEKAFGRLVGLLARRGYDPGLCRRAARVALELEAAEHEP